MTAPDIFSVVTAPESVDALPTPDNGPYFILSKDGVLVHRNFHFGRVVIPISKTEMLNPVESTLFWDIKVPRQIIEQAWSFFRAVYEARHSEAMVDIVYDGNEERRTARTAKQGWDDLGYRLFVPPQRASHGGVEAKRNGEHYRGQIVGTIHSHCDFGAFHSGTDTHDADSHDGLHITLGQNAHEQPEIAVMISVAPKRWDFKASEIWGDEKFTPIAHPKWWEGLVKDPLPANTGHVSTWKPTAGPTYAPVIYRGPATEVTKPKTVKYTPYDSIQQLLDSLKEYLDDGQVRSLEDAHYDLKAITDEMEACGFEFQYTIDWLAEETKPEPATDAMPSWVRRMIHEEEYIPYD